MKNQGQQSIQRQGSEQLQTSRLSPRDSASVKWLTLAAENAKTEVSTAMAQLWKEFLAPYPIENVERFFKSWIGRSTFMPSISQARTELDAMGIAEYQGFSEEEKRLAKEAEGSSEEASYIAKLKEIMDGKAMPPVSEKKRRTELKRQAEKLK